MPHVLHHYSIKSRPALPTKKEVKVVKPTPTGKNLHFVCVCFWVKYSSSFPLQVSCIASCRPYIHALASRSRGCIDIQRHQRNVGGHHEAAGLTLNHGECTPAHLQRYPGACRPQHRDSNCITQPAWNERHDDWIDKSPVESHAETTRDLEITPKRSCSH